MRHKFIRAIVVWMLAFICLLGFVGIGASVGFDWDDTNIPPVDSWTMEVKSDDAAIGSFSIPGITNHPYVIDGLQPGVTYWFTVFGVRNNLASEPSEILTWRTEPVQFTPPVVGVTTNFVLTGILTGSVTKYTAGLKWGLAPAPGNTNVVGYRVRVSGSGVLVNEITTVATSVQIPNLMAATPYDITVSAIDRYGGSTSNAVPVRLTHTALPAGKVTTYQTAFQVP